MQMKRLQSEAEAAISLEELLAAQGMEATLEDVPQMEEKEKRKHSPQLREMLVSWEKLRLLYNGVLLVLGVLLLFIFFSPALLAAYWLDLMFGSLMVAVMANIAFFLGPLLEAYTTAFLGLQWRPAARVVVLLAGLIFSALIFLGLIAGFGFSVWLPVQ